MLMNALVSPRLGTSRSEVSLLTSMAAQAATNTQGDASMKHMYVVGAAALLAAVGIAVAQESQTKPGGNVAVAQGPCAQGYERAAPGGRMQLTAVQKKNIDTNNDGAPRACSRTPRRTSSAA
jgi:hypothetical protein